MLSLADDNLDYGGMLNAPRGFELSFAICATYTLDLEALVGAYIALGLPVGCDSSIRDNPAHLFAALTSVQNKVMVFCEKGKIRCSKEYRQLYSMVEEGIVQVDLKGSKGSYPSFHPKIWLLRFTSDSSSAVKYRLCVLTRNLTLDGSWDLAASFEGDFKGSDGNRAQGGWPLWTSLTELAALTKKANAPRDQSKLLDKVLEELSFVYFGRSEGSYGLEFPYFLVSGFPCWRGGDHTNSLETYLACNVEKARRVLVISPFLPTAFDANNPIGQICKRVEEKSLDPRDVTLVIRRDALAGRRKGMEHIRGMRLIAVRDELMDVMPDGREVDAADVTPRDIHAKMFAFECEEGGKTITRICIGSANATTRAITVNHEFNFALQSDCTDAFDNLLADLALDDASLDASVFAVLTEKEIAAISSQEPEAEPKASRDYDHMLRNISAKMSIAPSDNPAGFDVEVDFSYKEEFAEVFQNCTAGLLSLRGERPALQKMEFHDIELLSLTEFVRISYCQNGERTMPRLIKCEVVTGSETLSRRQSALFGKMVASNDAALFDYLSFRLSENPEAFSAVEALRRNGGGQTSISVALNGLYESLLNAFSDKPDEALGVVDECAQLIDKLEESGEAMGKARSLLEAFRLGYKDAK